MSRTYHNCTWGLHRTAPGTVPGIALVATLLVLGVRPNTEARPPVPPGYVRSVVKTHTEETAFGDLDGDGRQDLITLRGNDIRWHLQEPGGAFPESPDTKIGTDLGAGVVATAPMPNRKGVEILIATADGLVRVRNGEKPGPALLRRATVLPARSPTPRLRFSPFVVAGPGQSRSVLLPTIQGLEVWTDGSGKWELASTIQNALKALCTGPEGNVAFTRRYLVDFTQQDTNHDGLADLLIGLPAETGMVAVGVFRQKKAGGFGSTPDLRLTWPAEKGVYAQLENINQDGRPDVVLNTPDRAPWIIPGTFSGKVLVRVYLSGPDGQLRGTPDFLFRRNDWSTASSLVDVNADGHPDFILGYLRINGVDDMIRLAREKRIPLELRTFLYGEGGYTREPTFTRDIELCLNRVHLQFDFELMPTVVGRFLCLNGDFNGDGCQDLVVKRSTEEIAVHFLRPSKPGFSSRPDLTFAVANTHRLDARDLNGDGRSDLIVDLDRRTKILFISRDRNTPSAGDRE